MLKCGVLWVRLFMNPMTKKNKYFFLEMEPKIVPIYFRNEMIPPTIRGEVERDPESGQWRPTNRHRTQLNALVREYINNNFLVAPNQMIRMVPEQDFQAKIEYEIAPLSIRVPPRSGGKRKHRRSRKARKSGRKTKRRY